MDHLSVYRWLGRAGVVLGLAAASLSSSWAAAAAGGTGPAVMTSLSDRTLAAKWYTGFDPRSRFYVSGGSNGAVTVAEDIAFRSSVATGGELVAGTAARMLSAGAVASVAGEAIAVATLAWAAVELYHDARCWHDGSQPMCDAGVDPGVEVSQTVCSSSPNGTTYCAASAAALAAMPGIATFGPDVNGGMYTGSLIAPPASRAVCGSSFGCIDEYRNGEHWTYYSILDGGSQSHQQPCPPSIDALNPAWSVLAGASPGPDGKCPTGRYNPSSKEEVADKVRPVLAVHPELGPKVVSDGLPYVDIDPVASPRSITGPDAQPGVPEVTTTTGPDGSTSTTTKTPTDHYTYTPGTTPSAPPTVSTSTTTVTNTCTGPNSCSTTTTTGQPADSTDQCKAHPESAGCAEMGDPGEGDVPKSTSTVGYQAEDVALPSGCPAPIDLHEGHTLSYQPTCDALVKVKPFVLAVAALGALGICLRSVQQG